MKCRASILGLALAVGMLSSTPAAAQKGNALRPVDQMVEDVGALSTSFRELQVQLRHPLGFDSVYHVPGRSDLYMRASGGLYAVFDQSAYARGEKGVRAVIPAGTTFYIGMPALAPSLPPVDPQTAMLRVSTRIDPLDGEQPAATAAASLSSSSPSLSLLQMTSRARIATMTPSAPGSPPAGQMQDDPAPSESAASALRTIATDADYREDRLRELMERASRTQVAPHEPSPAQTD
jgi:hypothetical protein